MGTLARRTIFVDESLKIRILPHGRAEAEAYCDDQPETFSSRARAKGRRTRSQEISDICKCWALKWDEQNRVGYLSEVDSGELRSRKA